MILPVQFVTGLRDDDTPNLSHAWARTIEGAQGGTWEAVHLLGTASLDALSGYVGQSRGRRPTDTWNTRPVPEVDHGGILAEDRDGAERVLAALAREPDTTFAAGDDPWPADRRLRAERDEHVGVLDRCPEDRAGQGRHAGDVLETASWRYKSAELEVRRGEEALREVGPLQRVRASGRVAYARAEARLAEARDSSSDARRTSQRLKVASASWRPTRPAEMHSWRGTAGASSASPPSATSSLVTGRRSSSLVRQDDPLAFGVERLRAARATCVDEHDRVRRSLRLIAPSPWREPAARPGPRGGRSPRLGPKLLPLTQRSRRPANGIGAGGIEWHLIGRPAELSAPMTELSSAHDRDRKAKEEAANVGEADRAHEGPS